MKTDQEGAQVDKDAALRKLEEYGERFMSMFDDEGGRKASTSGRSSKGLSGRGPKATSTAERTAGGGSPSSKKRTQPKQHVPAEGQKEAARLEPVTSPAKTNTGTKAKRKSGQLDEIDAIMQTGKKAKRSPSTMEKAGGDKGAKAAASAAAAAAAQQAAMADALRRERKLFMSHKASKVHEEVTAAPVSRAAAAPSADDAGLSPEEFQKLQMEVEKFAVSALDKKSAKQYKARMLARVGAKAEAGPRTALSIGKGMAKMAAKRQARALEEAIETGMVQRKGLGKKKRALQAKNRDRGLMEAGPSFKNGILRVKPLKKTRAESGKLRLPKGVL